ncbi:hypothetical protein AMAG_06623 [Allomyces macrogynus ATCC 38327]|uniref:Uncharacterized protein n=1 Tax=Allomyces macrogynus (strain ATCC 38327) TaxID=578462 RepID=A0A0L0SEJ8_ALLM3|nr:hypothetical protein AMAG_06623 [Allomyces macrogynus ATCC 38327]|eukprot:KNE60859.1 hypothetical protein AMAG_06623 [Allomyces macrogynus ATCC 38327]
MSGAANRRPATPAAGSITTPALPPPSPASPQAPVARPRPAQPHEPDRIREERLWSDRVARELAAQHDFDQAWGFMLPHHASRAEALRDRRAKQGLTVDPFNVHSILHPPARAPAVPIPTVTHAPKALVGGVTAAAVLAAESAPPPVRALLLNQHLDESTHRHQSVYKAAYTAAPVPSAPVSPPRKPAGTKAWGSPERRAAETDPAVMPRACGSRNRIEPAATVDARRLSTAVADARRARCTHAGARYARRARRPVVARRVTGPRRRTAQQEGPRPRTTRAR